MVPLVNTVDLHQHLWPEGVLRVLETPVVGAPGRAEGRNLAHRPPRGAQLRGGPARPRSELPRRRPEHRPGDRGPLQPGRHRGAPGPRRPRRRRRLAGGRRVAARRSRLVGRRSRRAPGERAGEHRGPGDRQRRRGPLPAREPAGARRPRPSRRCRCSRPWPTPTLPSSSTPDRWPPTWPARRSPPGGPPRRTTWPSSTRPGTPSTTRSGRRSRTCAWCSPCLAGLAPLHAERTQHEGRARPRADRARPARLLRRLHLRPRRHPQHGRGGGHRPARARHRLPRGRRGDDDPVAQAFCPEMADVTRRDAPARALGYTWVPA